jgi:hypothetical protein
MVEVVTGLVAEIELQFVGGLGGLVCDSRAERRAEMRNEGARMRAIRTKTGMKVSQ